MTGRGSELEPRERLELIARALNYCCGEVAREELVAQFRYETGRDPGDRDVDAVMARER